MPGRPRAVGRAPHRGRRGPGKVTPRPPVHAALRRPLVHVVRPGGRLTPDADVRDGAPRLRPWAEAGLPRLPRCGPHPAHVARGPAGAGDGGAPHPGARGVPRALGQVRVRRAQADLGHHQGVPRLRLLRGRARRGHLLLGQRARERRALLRACRRLPAVAQRAAGEVHRRGDPLLLPAPPLHAVRRQPRLRRPGRPAADRRQLRAAFGGHVLAWRQGEQSGAQDDHGRRRPVRRAHGQRPREYGQALAGGVSRAGWRVVNTLPPRHAKPPAKRHYLWPAAELWFRL
mmetsp:Transcript_3452/g.8895  ORF Transcript_3452/g.8895 Transcript_3452/m.8895 type:complete len:287 (-) Transcript_3452:101-961(-)